MAYVIAEPCIGQKDNSCVEVCPVDCIHPTPDEPDYDKVEKLYIDPDECIDCDACVEACPVDACFAEDQLPAEWPKFAQINAEYFAGSRDRSGGGDVGSGRPAGARRRVVSSAATSPRDRTGDRPTPALRGPPLGRHGNAARDAVHRAAVAGPVAVQGRRARGWIGTADRRRVQRARSTSCLERVRSARCPEGAGPNGASTTARSRRARSREVVDGRGRAEQASAGECPWPAVSGRPARRCTEVAADERTRPGAVRSARMRPGPRYGARSGAPARMDRQRRYPGDHDAQCRDQSAPRRREAARRQARLREGPEGDRRYASSVDTPRQRDASDASSSGRRREDGDWTAARSARSRRAQACYTTGDAVADGDHKWNVEG